MVARAMWNFGLSDLRLINPRDGWPNPAAGPAAAGADIVLERAQVYSALAPAVEDCHRVYATTVRPRGMLKEVVTARHAAAQAADLAAGGHRTAYLFGPERSGLDSADVARADAIVTVPVNPEFGSLNLAQAVVLCAYEWFQTSHEAPASQLHGDHEGPASRASLEGLIGHVTEELEARSYFYPEHRAEVMRRTLRGILQRPSYTEAEVRTLRGVIRSLADRPR